MRRKLGGHFWWVSLFAVFLGQTAFLFLALSEPVRGLGRASGGGGAPGDGRTGSGGAVSLARHRAGGRGRRPDGRVPGLGGPGRGGGGGRGEGGGAARESARGGAEDLLRRSRHERGAVGVQPAPELPGRDYVLVGPVPAVALRHGALEGVRARSPDAPVRPRPRWG